MVELIGPFKQVVTLKDLPAKGPVNDNQMNIVQNGGVVISDGFIIEVDNFDALKVDFKEEHIQFMENDLVLLPGFIDAHTHICWVGSRAKDFGLRNSGVSYLEIARQGGGIWETVTKTRAANIEELIENTVNRANQQLVNGITTIEVKSGYGLNLSDELKMLKAIKEAKKKVKADLISTCLAAHIIPKEFDTAEAYLDVLIDQLLPQVKEQNLAKRVDIFIEDTAFDAKSAEKYLLKAKSLGFDLVVHADQFQSGGSQVAVNVKALSADHLEASAENEIKLLAENNVACMVLPGASIGIGCGFAPARKILDAGASLVIASDWNPGSAPNGELLMQASILATFEKLSNAEVFAGITFRAAKALNLIDRGKIEKGMKADLVAFPCCDYREISYQQGRLKPSQVWKNGIKLINLKS